MAYTGKVFTLQHNWANPLRERLQMPCDVQVADDGTEIRRSLRLNPLRSYEFSVDEGRPTVRAYLEAFLDTSMTEEVLIPIRHDRLKLTAALSSGATSLAFDTEYLDYDDDGNCYVLFLRDHKTYEAVEVTSVDGGGIEFDATGTTWPVGTPFFPARPAKIDPQVQGVTIAGGIRSRTVKFDISPLSVSTNRYGSFTWPTLNIVTPHDLWLRQSETSSERDTAFVQDGDIEHTLTGLPSSFSTRKAAPYQIHDFHQLGGRAHMMEWLAFWKSRYGRRVPFWMPSWEKDFIPVSFASNIFTWQENGYTEFYNLRADRQWVFGYRTDGGYNIGRFTTCENNGDGTESATIGDGTLPSVANTRLVSFLRFCRMESDALEVEWLTSGDARSTTSFRQLFKTP